MVRVKVCCWPGVYVVPPEDVRTAVPPPPLSGCPAMTARLRTGLVARARRCFEDRGPLRRNIETLAACLLPLP